MANVPVQLEPQGLRTVVDGLRFPEGPVALGDGSVLVVEIARGMLSRVRPDGTVDVVAECGGGPNGAALGADGAVYVTNNGGCFAWREVAGMLIPGDPPPPAWPGHGSLQRVDVATGEVTTLYTECDGRSLRAPNDLVVDADGGIWFTDHGVREARSSDRTGVYWCLPDGSRIEEVAFPLDAPNGIGLSPAGDRLYVAETHAGRVWSWAVAGPGKLDGTNPVGPAGASLLADPGGHRLFDSLAVDDAGWVCVATLLHGGVTAVSPDGQQLEFTPLGDPLTTNLCFTATGRQAFATLSATGRLVTFEWPLRV
ncbi:MAG: SMP-30/gluconolactonase/LRE family protein [Acidimicrobiales bacterium]